MVRRANITRSIPLNTVLPEDLRARLDLHLYSEAEKRVPKDAISKFLASRVKEFFNWRVLDIGELLGYPPGTYEVKGNFDAIALLRAALEKRNHHGTNPRSTD